MSSGLPQSAAWRHVGAAEGFETLYLERVSEGLRLRGHSAGVENGRAFGIGYELVLDEGWTTRRAHIVGHGSRELRLDGNGSGGWLLDGSPASHLDGCLDVDLEASACTNALPVHRLGLAVREHADTPAAYVRTADLAVERLEQSYTRLDAHRYDYAAPRFDFEAVLVFDEHGLILEYPGIAVRVA